ncbi:hypothetical protein [Variovorax sp. RCC_210]|uniref:hypothetical protein n=1 Tax=Variovorax sp. RCC_210 TaxID=3239217 RepID=UPI0035265123
MRTILVATFLLISLGNIHAATPTEQHAIEQAKVSNDDFSKRAPGKVAQSGRAYADGSTLVHELVVAVNPNLPNHELATWRDFNRGVLLPKVCSMLRADEFFKSGFQIRYRYVNLDGYLLDDFTVNKTACRGY